MNIFQEITNIIFISLGIILILCVIGLYYLTKWIINDVKEEKEYRNKTKEIIVTIRNESDKDKIIKQIIESEASNDDAPTFRERSQRR